MRATFVDFEDSFSYNVIQELIRIGFEVEVLNWKDFEELPATDLLVLGPGPGHPDDYQQIFSLLRQWLTENRPLFGVCLGHQIFWRLQGEEIVRSKEPLHGQRVRLVLDKKWQKTLGISTEVWVQRYNSLCVPAQAELRNPYYQNLIFNEEIVITKSARVLTYQFHPESIGTTFRRKFLSLVWCILPE